MARLTVNYLILRLGCVILHPVGLFELYDPSFLFIVFYIREKIVSKVFFLHLPKTGGVTVETLLKQEFDDNQICPWYYEEDYYRGSSSPSNYSLFLGHVPYYAKKIIPETVYTFTIIREPVARTISAFEHIARDSFHPQNKMMNQEAPTLKQFMEHPRLGVALTNPQTRYLGNEFDFAYVFEQVRSHNMPIAKALHVTNEARRKQAVEDTFKNAIKNLESMDRFGLTDNLSVCLQEVQKDLGFVVNHEVPKMNANPGSGSALEKYSAEDLDVVRKYNEYDLKLFEYAKEKLKDH